MNSLSISKQIEIISCLVDGASIRATARICDVDKNSVMSLGLRVGEGAIVVHDRLFQNLHCSHLQLDELWSFCKKKRRNVTAEDPDTVGDIFCYLALDTASRSIISWQVGKRNWQNTRAIVEDVHRRVIGNPTICSDAFVHYQKAVDHVLQGEASHGLVDKQEVIVAKDADSDGKYYARQKLVRVERTAFSGNPEFITTSHIERANLTVRMGQRRFTRKTNGHSKKFRNHVAALSLFNAHYNLCKIHETLRVTPGMALGITQRVWSVGELVTAALTGEVQDQVGTIRSGFRVIQGGRND